MKDGFRNIGSLMLAAIYSLVVCAATIAPMQPELGKSSSQQVQLLEIANHSLLNHTTPSSGCASDVLTNIAIAGLKLIVDKQFLLSKSFNQLVLAQYKQYSESPSNLPVHKAAIIIYPFHYFW